MPGEDLHLSVMAPLQAHAAPHFARWQGRTRPVFKLTRVYVVSSSRRVVVLPRSGIVISEDSVTVNSPRRDSG